MKALKALVIFLGVLIIAGIGLVIYGVSTKLGPKPVAPVASGPAAVPGTAPALLDLTVPSGAHIERLLPLGDRLVVHLSGGGGERLLLLDPATGRLVGETRLVPESGPGPAR